jgi:hypothetical protein
MIGQFFSSVWRALGENAEQIKITAGLLVALFVLTEYLDKQWNDRINRSLGYVGISYGAHNVEAWFQIKSRLITHRVLDDTYIKSEFERFRGPIPIGYDEFKKIIVAEAIAEMKDGPNTGPSLTEGLQYLQGFYSSMANCALTRQCDVFTACTYFYDDVYSFREIFGSYLREWNDRWKLGDMYFLDGFYELCGARSVYFRAQMGNLSFLDDLTLYFYGLVNL